MIKMLLLYSLSNRSVLFTLFLGCKAHLKWYLFPSVCVCACVCVCVSVCPHPGGHAFLRRTFKLHTLIAYGRGSKPIDFGHDQLKGMTSKGQSSKSQNALYLINGARYDNGLYYQHI